MTDDLPAAYCFFQTFEPRPPLDAVFERDYLLYAVSGALRVTVKGESWLLPPSFAAWVPAGTPLLAEICKPVTTCSILVQPGFCKALPDRPTAFQMSEMTRHMIRHCKDWGADSAQPSEAAGFFLALLNACAGLSTRSVDVKRPFANDAALNKAIEVTETRLAEPITSAEVASAINLSERSMQRRFARDVGMTWSQVLTRLRMIHALELLSLEDLSVIEVAGDCGFNSLSAFNRAFLQFAKCTPTEFRKGLLRQ
ncbi:AraC family transcriptional regulator [Qingshengfaniella alkalisoli]|uniref:Helix-turn-helix transcriptional regulator n=1 Tax=Qingshengfaniella alkalisoli TaxID=2599296 RepID=A0A5B8JAT6_9RHOB|nr:helix-turn-helix transcriptional regulator [Qingshengfaniella alkalisoli]QDY71397.1 helix-turn-helix transcriptional regulator [Qingshengfaniella alkalisoli]